MHGTFGCIQSAAGSNGAVKTPEERPRPGEIGSSCIAALSARNDPAVACK